MFDSGRLKFDGVPSGDELMRQMKEDYGEDILLAFSRGKDSIATWLELRKHEFNVTPYYMYGVPDLEFVEESLHYYESYFGVRIARLPHPSLYRMLEENVFQTPSQAHILHRCDIRKFSLDDLAIWFLQDEGLPLSTWTAIGLRAADSMARRATIRMHGAATESRQVFYPIWDVKVSLLRNIVAQARISFPVDYRMFGRSLDGIDFRFVYPLKQYYPNDYNKILEWFPFAELEIFRYEQAIKHGIIDRFGRKL